MSPAIRASHDLREKPDFLEEFFMSWTRDPHNEIINNHLIGGLIFSIASILVMYI